MKAIDIRIKDSGLDILRKIAGEKVNEIIGCVNSIKCYHTKAPENIPHTCEIIEEIVEEIRLLNRLAEACVEVDDELAL